MKQKGFVILITTMMLSILTMLILSLMQSVFLYIKVSNQVLIKHELLYQLEAVAQQIVKADYSLDCLLREENPNNIIELLLQKQGCLFAWENKKYYYLINDLGLFPCLQMMSSNQVSSTHHWLVTVSSPPQQEILQLRVAKPAKAIACDFDKIRLINNGVISWRYLGHIENIPPHRPFGGEGVFINNDQ